MKGTILLNYNENTRQIEDEEKTRLLKNLLDQMGVPVQEFWADEIALSIGQKIKLGEILQAYNIHVIDDFDGGMIVYVDNDKIAEWYKPTYKLKRDYSQINPRKQLYLEMEVSFWTIFEETQQQ